MAEQIGLKSNASRYKGRIFNIQVGLSKAPFSAHHNVLSQSPVLRRKCSVGILELVLADKDPKIFGYLLEWLYTGQFYPFKSHLSPGDQTHRTTGVHQDLIGLYFMACDFEMNKLQDAVVEKLKLLEPINHKVFFVDANRVFARIPSVQGAYFKYFESAAELHIRAVLRDEWMLKLLEKGGPFARARGKVMGAILIKPEA